MDGRELMFGKVQKFTEAEDVRTISEDIFNNNVEPLEIRLRKWYIFEDCMNVGIQKSRRIGRHS